MDSGGSIEEVKGARWSERGAAIRRGKRTVQIARFACDSPISEHDMSDAPPCHHSYWE